MKYSPDAYLLYEAGKFVTFNISVKVVMKEPVDASTLKAAAEKAFCRFPYYHKQIFIDQDGGIDLIPNPRPIRVNPVSKKHPTLFSQEANYLPCSIAYEDNCIYFHMYHGMCGGCGTFVWVKTTLYEYLCACYGVQPEPGTTILTQTPVQPEEYAFPKLEDIPSHSPIPSVNPSDVWFPGLEYLLGFGRLLYSDSIHHELEIPKDALMHYAKTNDGTPMAVMTAVMFKALSQALPKNKLPFRAKSNHNYRAAVGCPKTHHDLRSPVFYFFPNHAKDWPLEKICTTIRGATLLQTEPEYAYDTLRRFYEFTSGVDNVQGMKEKRKYAKENSQQVFKLHSTFNINYTGQEDWGGMTEYVDQVYVVTDAHLLLEIADVGDKFCISFMQMIKKKDYLDNLCQILTQEGIPYTFRGTRKNRLPVSVIESAPVICD